MSAVTIPFRVLEINKTSHILVLLYNDLKQGNKKYTDFKKNLTLKVAELHGETFAIRLKFEDIDLTIPDFILSKEGLHISGLSLLKPFEKNVWTCGYYLNDEMKCIYPLKPLNVVLW